MTGTTTIDFDNIKQGDLMAFVYYTKVESIDAYRKSISVSDLDSNNENIVISGESLIEKSFSADQYQKEIKENKTRIAEILVNSTNHPFTVCFDKADGEERTMRGRLIKPEPILGRSMIEDLDLSSSHRVRQVDHRTLKWLIVDGVKYTVKGNKN